jgi:hypothetical protein
LLSKLGSEGQLTLARQIARDARSHLKLAWQMARRRARPSDAISAERVLWDPVY